MKRINGKTILIISILLAMANVYAAETAFGQTNSNPTQPESTPIDAWHLERFGHIGGTAGTIDVIGSYAFIGEGPRLAILDISEPSTPNVLGKTDPLPSIVREIKVANDVAYVATWLGGIQIIDVSDRTKPIVVGEYRASSAIQTIDVVDQTVYALDALGDVEIIDVTDQSNPEQLGRYDTPENGSATDIIVIGATLYVTDRQYGLRLIDVSIPSDPVELGDYEIEAGAYNIVVADHVAYITAHFSHMLATVNISDPTDIAMINSIPTQGAISDIGVRSGYV